MFKIENYQELYQFTYLSTDKIVLKVNKVPGETIPLLMEYGPSYVSPNSVVGHKEATKFFPPSYKSAQQEEAELHAVKAEKPKKRKKVRRSDEEDNPVKNNQMLCCAEQEGRRRRCERSG